MRFLHTVEEANQQKLGELAEPLFVSQFKLFCLVVADSLAKDAVQHVVLDEDA